MRRATSTTPRRILEKFSACRLSAPPRAATHQRCAMRKPFPTGDPDIAGFDDQAPDRRILGATANPANASNSSALGRRVYQRGLQTFVWRSDDDNDDELRYRIMYRREGDTEWKTLKSDL